MFYPFLISGDTDDHDQPTSSVHVQEGPASTIQEHRRVFNYMQPRSGGSNPRNRNSASSKKGKSKLQSCTLKFSFYPKLILKNHQALCLKRLDFQIVALGQGQSLLTSTAVLVMSTTTLWKGSLFCKLGEDMNCCFTSEGD